jgi:hypothetical protein
MAAKPLFLTQKCMDYGIQSMHIHSMDHESVQSPLYCNLYTERMQQVPVWGRGGHMFGGLRHVFATSAER